MDVDTYVPWVHPCICIYMRTHIYSTIIYMYTYNTMYTYTHIYINEYMRKYPYIHIHTYLCTYIYAYIHVYTYIHVNIYVRVYICIYTCMYVCWFISYTINNINNVCCCSKRILTIVTLSMTFQIFMICFLRKPRVLLHPIKDIQHSQ